MQTQTRRAQACREFEAESGLYYYRARYYDPTSGKFASLDDTLCPVSPDLEGMRCKGDFSNSKAALLAAGFTESDYDDVFGVVMALGAYCDCEVLYNAAEANRLKSRYWKTQHAALGQSNSQVS